jgi:hypothetical protein
MSESVSIPEERPSAIGSFLRGALSSAMTGALMAGIVALVTTALPFITAAAGVAPAAFGPAFWVSLKATALLMIPATALFGGIMAAKRAMFDAPAAANAPVNYIPVPVQGLSGPALAPTIAADRAVDSDSPNTNWVEKTGRGDNAQRQIDAILAKGAANDSSRASAVLAAREASVAQERSV